MIATYGLHCRFVYRFSGFLYTCIQLCLNWIFVSPLFFAMSETSEVSVNSWYYNLELNLRFPMVGYLGVEYLTAHFKVFIIYLNSYLLQGTIIDPMPQCWFKIVIFPLSNATIRLTVVYFSLPTGKNSSKKSKKQTKDSYIIDVFHIYVCWTIQYISL